VKKIGQKIYFVGMQVSWQECSQKYLSILRCVKRVCTYECMNVHMFVMLNNVQNISAQYICRQVIMHITIKICENKIHYMHLYFIYMHLHTERDKKMKIKIQFLHNTK
jgi:hypothetical protein